MPAPPAAYLPEPLFRGPARPVMPAQFYLPSSLMDKPPAPLPTMNFTSTSSSRPMPPTPFLPPGFPITRPTIPQPENQLLIEKDIQYLRSLSTTITDVTLENQALITQLHSKMAAIVADGENQLSYMNASLEKVQTMDELAGTVEELHCIFKTKIGMLLADNKKSIGMISALANECCELKKTIGWLETDVSTLKGCLEDPANSTTELVQTDAKKRKTARWKKWILPSASIIFVVGAATYVVKTR